MMNSNSAGEYSGSPGSVFVQAPPTHHYCSQTDRISLRFDYPVIMTKHHGFGDASLTGHYGAPHQQGHTNMLPLSPASWIMVCSMSKNAGGDPLTLSIEGQTITCRIRRSVRAKNIGLRILDDGSLGITLPAAKKRIDLDRLLSRHRRWILKNLERSSKEKLLPPFILAEGGVLPVLDYECYLRIVTSSRKRARVEFDPPHINLHVNNSRFDTLYPLVEGWYRKMARKFLRDRIPYWVGRLKVVPEGLRVKNQRTLWGSCSRRKNLNFNWRILLLSPETADYLIIHELSHLKHMNHSGKFWNTVKAFCPGYKDCQRELRSKNHWLKYPEGFKKR